MNNNTAQDLLDEIENTQRDNQEFLNKIDQEIASTDLKYAQALIDEEKTYLNLVKKDKLDK